MIRLLSGLIFLLMAYVISLYYSAFLGLQLHLGTFGAIFGIFASFYSRLFVIIVIAGLIGMVQVWQWHWVLSLIYISPALIITWLLLQSRGYANQWRRSYHYFNHEMHKSTLNDNSLHENKDRAKRNEKDIIDID